MTDITLVLGGARSGKSRLAEQRARDSGLNLIYVATATAGDDEMRARIERHQLDRRDQGWTTIEQPLDLAAVIAEQAGSNNCMLIDCLTLWLSNCLHHDCWPEQKNRFLQALQKHRAGRLIMVSNETGLGVVPMGELTRQFVDEAGLLHQDIASMADRVTFVVAGLATELK